MVLGLGTPELLVVLLVVLVFFGPEQIPKVAREVGFYSAKLRRSMGRLRETLDEETKEPVEYPPPTVTGPEIPPGHD